MGVEIGDRVGAIQSQKNGKTEFFGFGVYEGKFDPKTGDIRPFLGNPRIKLDDGGYVWGFECWWGAEDRIKTMMEGTEIVMVKPQMSTEAPLRKEA